MNKANKFEFKLTRARPGLGPDQGFSGWVLKPETRSIPNKGGGARKGSPC